MRLLGVCPIVLCGLVRAALIILRADARALNYSLIENPYYIFEVSDVKVQQSFFEAEIDNI